MKKFLSVVLLCCAVAAPALAQSSRYYGAVDFGSISMSGPGVYYGNPGALTVSGGYQHSPHLALEAGVTLIGSTQADIPGWGRVSFTQTIVSGAILGQLPISNVVTLFGKAGLAAHNEEIYLSPDDLILGLGAKFQINRELSLRAQYENLGRARIPYTTSRVDLTRLSVGAAYHF